MTDADYREQFYALHELWWQLRIQRDRFPTRGPRYRRATELIEQIERVKARIKPLAFLGQGGQTT